MAGNQFTSGGDVANGVLAQPAFSDTHASEVYPLGTVRLRVTVSGSLLRRRLNSRLE